MLRKKLSVICLVIVIVLISVNTFAAEVERFWINTNETEEGRSTSSILAHVVNGNGVYEYNADYMQLYEDDDLIYTFQGSELFDRTLDQTRVSYKNSKWVRSWKKQTRWIYGLTESDDVQFTASKSYYIVIKLNGYIVTSNTIILPDELPGAPMFETFDTQFNFLMEQSNNGKVNQGKHKGVEDNRGKHIGWYPRYKSNTCALTADASVSNVEIYENHEGEIVIRWKPPEFNFVGYKFKMKFRIHLWLNDGFPLCPDGEYISIAQPIHLGIAIIPKRTVDYMKSVSDHFTFVAHARSYAGHYQYRAYSATIEYQF